MIYLDNAATTLKKPEVVKEAILDAINTLGNAGRGATSQSLNTSHLLYEARNHLNQLINGQNAKQVVFTANATESLNTAIKGLFSPGDHVITSVMEHNSVLRPLYELEKQGVELSFLNVHSNGNINPKDLVQFIQHNTKGIVITHESNVTGNIVPIKEISKIATEQDLLLIVDAAQTMGAVPIDVKDLNIDVLCFTGHKSLLGPQGTGGMYVREGLQIRPLKSGGSGIKTYQKAHPSEMPTALEAGTMNGHGIAGLNASLKFLLEQNISTIHHYHQQLINYFFQEIKDIKNVQIYGDFNSPHHGGILSLNIGDIDSSIISDRLLEDFNISTRPGGHCAPLMHQALGTDKQGVVRFSTSYYTKKEEIDRSIQAIQQLANIYQ